MVDARATALSDSTSDNHALANAVGMPGGMDDLGCQSPACGKSLFERIRIRCCVGLRRAHSHGFNDAHGCPRSVSFLSKLVKADSFRESDSGILRGGDYGHGRFVLYVFCGAIAIILSFCTPAYAGEVACPKYNVFSKLMTDICWNCMFPITIAGVPMNFGSSTKPSGAAKTSFTCSCPSKGSIIPNNGFPFSMWAPARLVEVVRRPYCFPTFGGSIIKTQGGSIGADSRMMGGPGPGTTEHDSSDSVFYHYHYFAFPLTVMLNLFSGCTADGYVDFDLMYLSELDPTWNDSEMAFYLNPETVLIANPVAQAACIGDALASNIGNPSDSMFWCAGSWGGLYPLTGTVITNGDPPANTSLIVARSLAALHRRGLAWKTMGKTAMCGAYIYPTLPKTQYKFEQLYPVGEANGNHWIGQSPFVWGEWRNVPGVGEDFVHMIWRWQDCCVSFL